MNPWLFVVIVLTGPPQMPIASITTTKLLNEAECDSAMVAMDNVAKLAKMRLNIFCVELEPVPKIPRVGEEPQPQERGSKT